MNAGHPVDVGLGRDELVGWLLLLLESFNQAPGREVEEVGVDEGAPGEGLQLPPEALLGAGCVGVDHKLVGADEVPEGDHAGGSRLTHRPPYLDLHRGRVFGLVGWRTGGNGMLQSMLATTTVIKGLQD